MRVFLFLILILTTTSCQQAPREYKQTLLIFGTLINVTLWDVEPARAEKAIADIRKDLEFMHEVWHPWQRGPLGRTNELLATTGWFSFNPSVMSLIYKGTELSEASEGLFNPAIGRLIKLWGYHSDTPPSGPPPPFEDIATLLAENPQMSDIEVKGIRIRSRNPAVSLDFGAIAKGLALDRLMRHLKNSGIDNAIINAGGDLKVIGKHGQRPWRVGIRHPRPPEDDQGKVLAALDVNDGESVFTSGDYERYYDYQGRRYHHIIDPRTGYPADKTTSVTVIHPSATTADAAATALFVAGPEAWIRIAKKMGLKYVMLVDKAGQIYMSPAMAARLEFTDAAIPPGHKPILSPPL